MRRNDTEKKVKSQDIECLAANGKEYVWNRKKRMNVSGYFARITKRRPYAQKGKIKKENKNNNNKKIRKRRIYIVYQMHKTLKKKHYQISD